MKTTWPFYLKWWLFTCIKEQIRWLDFPLQVIYNSYYLSISSCQYRISGLKEISLHQQNVEYAMRYVAVKGGSRGSDAFGVI